MTCAAFVTAGFAIVHAIFSTEIQLSLVKVFAATWKINLHIITDDTKACVLACILNVLLSYPAPQKFIWIPRDGPCQWLEGII